jgi:hypothetical protein
MARWSCIPAMLRAYFSDDLSPRFCWAKGHEGVLVLRLDERVRGRPDAIELGGGRFQAAHDPRGCGPFILKIEST